MHDINRYILDTPMIHSRYKHVLSYVKSEVYEVCWFAVISVKGDKNEYNSF